MTEKYDAVLVVSFGGPEGMEDVMPFLENVLRGRNVPRERMLAVAHHYELFGGVSPINQQNRDLIDALKIELQKNGIELPIYWGNRNWHPMLTDTLAQMRDDGVKSALAFVTSAYSSYSSCRQYRENIDNALSRIDAELTLRVEKLRAFFNHPGFIKANADRLDDALNQFDDRRPNVHVAFTAHSIPMSMADSCDYQMQLEETARMVAKATRTNEWHLCFQSRSGPANQPWLEPDICDLIRTLADQGVRELVIAPIGFVSDHMEIKFDLDVEAKQLCDELGVTLVRASTAGTHPSFVKMVRQLIEEKLDETKPLAVGKMPARSEVCALDCCPAPVRPAAPPTQ